MNEGRFWAYACTIGGALVSLLANVQHSFLLPHSTRSSTVGSALAPLFLLGAVEVILKIKWRRSRWSVVVRCVMVPIAGIAAYISWAHMSSLLRSWGWGPAESALGPVLVDAVMLLAAGALMLEDRITGTTELVVQVAEAAVVPDQAPAAVPDPVVLEDQPEKTTQLAAVRSTAAKTKTTGTTAVVPAETIEAAALRIAQDHWDTETKDISRRSLASALRDAGHTAGTAKTTELLEAVKTRVIKERTEAHG